jgi:hypothetical protein
VRRLALVVDASDLPDAVARGVFGVDIDEGACGRARDAVRAAVADLSGPQPEAWFDDNVRVADFLELEADPTFTFVVGNPPYVSALHLNAEQKRRYLARFETAWGRLDLYALFIEHGLGFLAIDGTLAYITPDKWLGAESSVRLRTFVSRGFSVRSIDRFDRHDLFPGVAMVPCVSVIARLRSAEQTPGTAACRWWDLDTDGRPIPVGSPEPVRLCSERWTGAHQVSDGTVPLGSLAERISVGLATGLNCCFVVDSDQAQWIEPELLRPVARGRDVLAGEVRDSGLWLLLPYEFDAEGGNPELVELARFPGARAHLEAHRAALERRHCVRVWNKAWYDLHDPVVQDLAPKRKVLLPDLARVPRFAADPGVVVPLHSVYYIALRDGAECSADELACVLNTAQVKAELRRRAPTAKSGYRRFRAQVLRDLPVPRPGQGVIDAA